MCFDEDGCVEYGIADLHFRAIEYSAPLELLYIKNFRGNKRFQVGIGICNSIQLLVGQIKNKRIK